MVAGLVLRNVETSEILSYSASGMGVKLSKRCSSSELATFCPSLLAELRSRDVSVKQIRMAMHDGLGLEFVKYVETSEILTYSANCRG